MTRLPKLIYLSCNLMNFESDFISDDPSNRSRCLMSSSINSKSCFGPLRRTVSAPGKLSFTRFRFKFGWSSLMADSTWVEDTFSRNNETLQHFIWLKPLQYVIFRMLNQMCFLPKCQFFESHPNTLGSKDSQKFLIFEFFTIEADGDFSLTGNL